MTKSSVKAFSEECVPKDNARPNGVTTVGSGGLLSRLGLGDLDLNSSERGLR